MIEQLPLTHVFTRKDSRPIVEATVRGLVESIKEVGIINPIRVRTARRFVAGVEADAWEVTAGAHRVTAARRLGLETVPAIVVSDDDLHAELAMIDENLMRAELSPADRASQTARRKAIYLELHPETAHGVAGATSRWDENANLAPSFVEATSEATGKGIRTVSRDVERGEKICEEALSLVRGTELDTGTYLDKLKKLTPDDQVETAKRAIAGVARRDAKFREQEQEARNKARVEADIKSRAANEIAEILAEHVPADFWDAIKANLGVTTSQKILASFTNLVGHSITEAAE